jgi:hypothetical protein
VNKSVSFVPKNRPTRALVALLSVLAIIGSLMLGSSPALADQLRSAARIDIVVQGGGLITPGDTAALSVILRADETGTLGTGDVTLKLTESRFTSEEQIRRFLAGESNPVFADIAQASTPEVPQLESREVPMSLESDLWESRLPEDEPTNSSQGPRQQAGIFGLEIVYTHPSNMNPNLRQLSGRQVIIVVPEDLVIPRANIAPIVTLTTAAAGGLALGPEELQALTISGGAVDVVTGAVRDHPATIAIDSRITTSISALGDQAPSEALKWASTLGSIGLAQFGLPWADADPLGSLAIDTLTYARLGEYPWIQGDAVTNEDLETLATRSASAILVSSNSIPSDRAVVSIGQARVIRVDAQLSALAMDALQAPTPLEAEADMQRAQGLIAYRALTGNQEILVFSTGRLPATAIAPRISEVLGRLVAMPVSNSVAVPLTAAPTEVLGGVLGTANPRDYLDFLGEIRELWEGDVAFATIASDPEGAIFSRWTRYQALLSSTWSENSNGLETEWERAQEDSRNFRNSVRVEQGSAITVLSDQTSLPVTVVNDLASDVVVVLSVRPTTGILAVETPEVRLAVPAGSAVRTLVPVQSLANGTVPVEFMLLSSGGTQVGETVTIPVTIRAGWEGVISVGLAIIVGGTFAFGVLRALQRRRSDTRAEVES